MKIIVDMMGGDNAPLAPLQGAAQAVAEYGVEIIAVGDEPMLRKEMAAHGISDAGMTFVHCTETIEMCDEPAFAVRRKKDSSIVVGVTMLKNGAGDAFVSAGSTGAVHVATSLFVRTLPTIKRPALAVIVPSTKNPYLLMDAGANVECRPEMLVGFGIMGSCYMQSVMGVAQPKVALANNGVEESKGTEMYRKAHQLLKATPSIHFTGNIEPRNVPYAEADVVVCDGFTGNVYLKLTEGVAGLIMGMIKDVFKANFAGNLAYLLVKKGMNKMKVLMDSEAHGGAPLLGARKPVIKAHGSSEARGIKNAIRQAKLCVDSNLCGTMEAALLATQENSQQA